AQKRRVQRLRNLELAEEEYLRLLKKVPGQYQIPSLRPKPNNEKPNNVWRRKVTLDSKSTEQPSFAPKAQVSERMASQFNLVAKD
ncbi:hypothetical protein, partial [Klebsiella pneumoniae]|uniref:hypothetical protein n=1 Tax=Klebsiella pneumoniae TaxID=573 RepID=UPI0024DEF0B9